MAEYEKRGLRIVAEQTVMGVEPRIVLQAFRGDQPMGHLSMMGRKDNTFQVQTLSVNEKRAKVGTALYEVALRIACRRGRTLTSDLQRSTFAEAFWRKQAAKRRAVCADKNVDRDHNVYGTPVLEMREAISRECRRDHPFDARAHERCTDMRVQEASRRFPKPKDNKFWPCLRWKMRPETCGGSSDPDLSGIRTRGRRR